MGRFHGKAWEGAGRHGKRFGKVFPWEGLPTGDQPSATLPAFPGKGGEGGNINPIYGLAHQGDMLSCNMIILWMVSVVLLGRNV